MLTHEYHDATLPSSSQKSGRIAHASGKQGMSEIERLVPPPPGQGIDRREDGVTPMTKAVSGLTRTLLAKHAGDGGVVGVGAEADCLALQVELFYDGVFFFAGRDKGLGP